LPSGSECVRGVLDYRQMIASRTILDSIKVARQTGNVDGQKSRRSCRKRAFEQAAVEVQVIRNIDENRLGASFFNRPDGAAKR